MGLPIVAAFPPSRLRDRPPGEFLPVPEFSGQFAAMIIGVGIDYSLRWSAAAAHRKSKKTW
jgi:hypothetical protein